MALSLFLLVQAPKQPDERIRGVFTTVDKAKNHDKTLAGRWETGPDMGQYMVGEEGSVDHHVIRLQHANEEIQY